MILNDNYWNSNFGFDSDFEFNYSMGNGAHSFLL